MQQLIINGEIETIGPLSISMPDTEDYEGFPVMTRGLDAAGAAQKTGYLPATTLRGFLRRAVVLRDMRAAKAEGHPYTLQRAYAELIGQDIESEKQAGEIDLVEVKRAREGSAVIDLFGSGLLVASRLRVSHFVPTINILPEEMKTARKDLHETDGVLDLLAAGEGESYAERSSANTKRVQTETLVRSLTRDVKKARDKNEDLTELEKQLAEAKRLVDKYKVGMGKMQVSTKQIISLHALPAGLKLHGRLVVSRPKARDLEMLIYGLDCLSRSPVLGAQSARGCGEIAGHFDVSMDGELVKRITIGDYKPAEIDDFATSELAFSE